MGETLRDIFAGRYRNGDQGHNTVTGWDFSKDAPLRRGRAVRVKCLECQNGNAAEVNRCQITDCALWPYRMGGAAKAKTQLKANVEAVAALELNF